MELNPGKDVNIGRSQKSVVYKRLGLMVRSTLGSGSNSAFSVENLKSINY
jgi:hypothetical protein